jgi:polysaccharide export outer membrane protein
MLRLLFVIALITVAPLAAVANETPDYVIGDGDVLQVSVWGEPQLSGQVIVRPDGKITLPAVGDLVASGHTAEGLSESVTQRLKRVVKKPLVTITVTTITNNKVYVFGGGVVSGVHTLTGRTSLLQFLCSLGDFSNADLENSHIVRNEKILNVDFYELFVKGNLSKDITLKPGDLIFISNNLFNKIYVMGAVKDPQQMTYWKGMRVVDAILAAGGFDKYAKENDVVVLRGSSKKVRVKVKDLMEEGDVRQNITLLPGDYIIVQESIF